MTQEQCGFMLGKRGPDILQPFKQFSSGFWNTAIKGPHPSSHITAQITWYLPEAVQSPPLQAPTSPTAVFSLDPSEELL